MGWFGSSSSSKISSVSQTVEEPQAQPQPQQFLEDLPPKFEDNGSGQKPPAYSDALKEFKLSDFSMSHFVSMPCFREAMITGFQAMGVLGTVTFLIHKNPNKSMNWAVCGFFLGNVVGWEQCHSIRRKSFQAMEKAKEANQKKNEKKWEEKQQEDDEVMKKFNDVQGRNK
ncbi:unnamed protein product [Debaryomyces tyrocola]|nr:unnamed protein product [Debaryomyces tyrocola]